MSQQLEISSDTALQVAEFFETMGMPAPRLACGKPCRGGARSIVARERVADLLFDLRAIGVSAGID